MPTPAEQKALAFVALVILLGGAVRVGRGSSASPSDPNADEVNALTRQTFAAESAGANTGSRTSSKRSSTSKRARKHRDDRAKNGGDVAESTSRDRLGFPPPSARIDIPGRAGAGTPSDGPRAVSAVTSRLPSASARRPTAAAMDASTPEALLDLDRATATEIEALPRIGPAIARRIVASRDSLGPFGSLAALGRVKGVGPATLGRLAPLVTFSGQARR